MLYTRKQNFYKSILLRIIKTLSTAKISPEIPKYLISLSIKFIFLGKDFISSFNVLFQRGF